MNQIIKIITVLLVTLACWRPAPAQTQFTEVAERAGVANSESNAIPSASAEVELGVYDLTGQRVALLVSGTREAGTYAVAWDGRDERGRELASGTYLYRLRAGEREETRKLALLR